MEEKNNSSGNKVNISTQKMLGGIGLLISPLSAIPFLGVLFWIASGILLLVSFNQLSKTLNKPDMFKKFLTGFIIGFVSYIVFYVLGFILLFFTLILAYIISIIVAYYYKQAYDMLANALNHKLFSKGARLMFIGAITTIILVGFILLFVGWVMLAVAFFTAPEEVEVVG
jgi:Predicted membrane protein